MGNINELSNIRAQNESKNNVMSKIEMENANKTIQRLNQILNAPKVSVQSLYLQNFQAQVIMEKLKENKDKM